MRVARAAQALGMHVRGHRSASTPAELSALLAAADAVSLVRARLPCLRIASSGGTLCGPGRPLTAAGVIRTPHKAWKRLGKCSLQCSPAGYRLLPCLVQAALRCPKAIVPPSLSAASRCCWHRHHFMPLQLGRGFTGLVCAGGQHCPLTPATVGLLGARELRAMKPGALVINYGRGELIDKQVCVRSHSTHHVFARAS